MRYTLSTSTSPPPMRSVIICRISDRKSILSSVSSISLLWFQSNPTCHVFWGFPGVLFYFSDIKLVKVSDWSSWNALFTVLYEDIIYLITSMEPHHLLSYRLTLMLLIDRNMMLQAMIVLLLIIFCQSILLFVLVYASSSLLLRCENIWQKSMFKLMGYGNIN